MNTIKACTYFIMALALLTSCQLAEAINPLGSNASRYQVNWEEAQYREGTTTFDSKGSVLIIGGNQQGPVNTGGQATWQVMAKPGTVTRVAATIYTNGDRWIGKGIHSAAQGGKIQIYINDALVHSASCDSAGMYGDYWCTKVGQAGYTTGVLDVTPLRISGPEITIRIAAHPATVIDFNHLDLLITSTERND